MDLLNKEFIDEATVLPGIYEILSTHLESESSWEQVLQRKSYLPKKLGMPNKTWEEIYNASSIIHFTRDKPTIYRTLVAIKNKVPGADPRFYAIYERYFSLASKVCPSGERYSLHGINFSILSGQLLKWRWQDGVIVSPVPEAALCSEER
mmetsp:Transcript_24692/g.40475  ORF Transcript_24692/g.40475 Transcript_24692/m.40475 type:complete len:150 (-) Transcript_24692:990-1439(-)